MTVHLGSEFEIYVETASVGVFVAVNDLNAFSKNTQRDSQSFPVFMRSTPHTSAGTREQSYSASGYLSPDDAGQQRLFTIEEANTPVKIRVLFDGANGFEQEVRVTSFTFDADPEGLQEIGFEFAATADPSVVGTGPKM